MRKRFFIPAPIYEILPLAYVVAGILLFMDVAIIARQFIGVMLVIAGLLITHLRVQHRMYRRERNDQ